MTLSRISHWVDTVFFVTSAWKPRFTKKMKWLAQRRVLVHFYGTRELATSAKR